jgi:hypothetical protein
MWSIGIPSTTSGWVDFVFSAMVPLLIGLALYDKVNEIADNIYDGSTE